MSIAVSVPTTSRVARNSGGAARHESNPQSATAYSSVRYGQFKKQTDYVLQQRKIQDLELEKSSDFALDY